MKLLDNLNRMLGIEAPRTSKADREYMDQLEADIEWLACCMDHVAGMTTDEWAASFLEAEVNIARESITLRKRNTGRG
jgi:hypothetical protein